MNERGINLSVGDSKHSLLLAKEALLADSRKDVAFRCRQAIEIISEQLWKKLSSKMNTGLSVKMRSPTSKPDSSSIVDGLIKELKSIKGSEELLSCFIELKEQYTWCLFNKGTHEQGDLPEFERKDVSDLLNLLMKTEDLVQNIKFEATLLNLSTVTKKSQALTNYKTQNIR